MGAPQQRAGRTDRSRPAASPAQHGQPTPRRTSCCSCSPPASEMPSEVIRLALSSTTSSTTRPFHVSMKRDSGTSTSLHSPLLQQKTGRMKQKEWVSHECV